MRLGLLQGDANGCPSCWQCVAELGTLDEQQRLAAIERGWSSSWLAALRQHLHLKPAELEPLLALSEATMARRARDQVPLDLVASERLDRLVEVISWLALTVRRKSEPGPFWFCKSVTDNHATGGEGFNLGIGRPQVIAAVSGSIPNSELPDKMLGNSLDLT